MANEIYLMGYPAGLTVYAIVRNASGQVWYETGGAFEAWGTGSRSEVDYAITLTDKSGALYVGDFPSSISAGTYKTIVFRQLGAQPASTDNVIGGQSIVWTGVAEAAAADVETGATDLVNWGLLKVGGAKDDAEQIDDIEGSDDFSVKCKLVYQFCRNSVLQSWPYNECREYAELTETSDTVEQADWDYVFDLPSDYLMPVAQIDQDDRTTKYEYAVRGGYLFTNDYSNSDGDAAYINYIKKVTDASQYSPALQEAIATKFASEMAPTLNPQNTVLLKREFDQICQPDAEALNQLGQYDDDEGSYSWKDARTA